MLVLSRKVGERIVVADTIVVTVLQVEAGKVRIGIEAPPDVRILRQELEARDARLRVADAFTQLARTI